jgi:hypothetical protein
VLAYDPVVQLETFTGTRAGYLLEKIIGLSVLSVLTIVSPHTEPPPYEFARFVASGYGVRKNWVLQDVLDNCGNEACCGP